MRIDTLPRTLVLLLLAAALVSPVSRAVAQDDPAPLLDDPAAALVLIDIQDFYFPGGAMPLVGAAEASANAGRVLQAFREAGRVVVHVGHQVRAGGGFDAAVAPLEGETVVMKTEVNAFQGTGLNAILQEAGIRRLVLCGMQTHMCLEGATRAAADLGYECTVVADACATRDLERAGTVVDAMAVHQATLVTLDGVYARVLDADDLLEP